jgi:hypothetical protein
MGDRRTEKETTGRGPGIAWRRRSVLATVNASLTTRMNCITQRPLRNAALWRGKHCAEATGERRQKNCGMRLKSAPAKQPDRVRV